jgi:histidinol phosphatase-like PHP family hydrolase
VDGDFETVNQARDAILDLIPDAELMRVFKKAAEVGVGIELNYYDIRNATESTLRPFRIAKAQGCRFYLGSDAHHPRDLDPAIAGFENVIDRLGLTEDDKFHIEA